MYRFERILREATKLRDDRVETFRKDGVTIENIDAQVPHQSVMIRALELDGFIPEGVLDQFELDLTHAMRGVVKASLAKQAFFDGLAPHTLHGRNMVKERVRTIAYGMSSMALCAMEERIAVAARRVMLTVMLDNHRSLEPGLDYGDKAYLVGMGPEPDDRLVPPDPADDASEDEEQADTSAPVPSNVPPGPADGVSVVMGTEEAA